MNIRTLAVAISGGVVLGVLAHWGHPDAQIVGAMFGAVVGVATVPIVQSVARHRSLLGCILLIYMPAAIAAVYARRIASEAPFLSLGLVLAALGIGAGLAAGMLPMRLCRTACPVCGYDKAGLPSARCPECGQEAETEPEPEPRKPWLAVVSVLLGCIFLMTCPIVVERERRWQNPRTCEEAMCAVMSGSIVIKERAVRVLMGCGPRVIAEAAARSTGWTRQSVLSGVGRMSPVPGEAEWTALTRSEDPLIRGGGLLVLEVVDKNKAAERAREMIADETDIARNIAKEVLWRHGRE